MNGSTLPYAGANLLNCSSNPRKVFQQHIKQIQNVQHDSKQQNADQQRSRQQKNDNHQEL